MNKQRGIALLTALMMVALATIAISSMVNKQYFNIRRAKNAFNTDQAYLHALSIEGWMRAGILGDDRKKNEFDHLDELWASTVFRPMDEEESTDENIVEFDFESYIVDKQGCFNVNNLIEPVKPDSQDQKVNEEYDKAVARHKRWLKRFDVLLDELNVNAFISKEVFIDWADDNQELSIVGSSTGGAEDSEYGQREQPYRTSDTLFVDESEFRLLNGMDEEIQVDIDDDGFPDDTTVYEVVKPHICALPVETKININTASAPVMASLLEGLSVTDLKSLAEPGEADAAKDIEKFLEKEFFQAWGEQKLDERNQKTDTEEERQGLIDGIIAELAGDFTVVSDYFQIHIKVEHNGSRGLLRSVVFRNNEGETTTILREQGRYPPPKNAGTQIAGNQ